MPSIDTLLNLALIIFGFGLLIFVHELGHFLAAKWAGIRAEGFAIGMWKVLVSWRKGIGLRFGSSENEYVRRAEEHLRVSRPELSHDQLTRGDVYAAADEIGLGETEYSLRVLPLGGFVKMLGQEDANPQAVSDLPGSYNRCPVGKRMVVVSAGVIMNLLLAVGFFIWAFLVGVPFEAPIVGASNPELPAARAVALNADELGITEPGLAAGDRVIAIDGKEPRAFGDLMITTAMSKKGTPIDLDVERVIGGSPRVLHFSIVPEMNNGLLALGLYPAASTQLYGGSNSEIVEAELAALGLADKGLRPGMRMVAADGQAVNAYHEYQAVVEESDGLSVETSWTAVDSESDPVGNVITVSIPVRAELGVMEFARDGQRAQERGFIGLPVLAKVGAVDEESPNKAVLRAGDVLLRVGGVDGPAHYAVSSIISEHPGETIDAIVLRDGEEMPLQLKVGGNGRVGIITVPADDVPYVGQTIERIEQVGDTRDESRARVTPVAGHEIFAGSRILSVEDLSINDWSDLRAALRNVTRDAHARGEGAVVSVEFELRVGDRPRVTESLELTAEDVAELHELGWTSDLDARYFESIQVIQSAHGNPFVAVAMGFDRTWMAIKNVYLTIVRLFQRSVGVDQLRGPVGIVHLGVQIADRGFMYLIYLLAMISVNLAVINFLPLPIVDGGLFLFLIYEKFKGRPPSIAFQNAVTILGLLLLVSLFLVVTYNDIARLFTG